MTRFFQDCEPVRYQGPDCTVAPACRWYEPDRILLGRCMEEIVDRVEQAELNLRPRSGRQEYPENLRNRYLGASCPMAAFDVYLG